MMKQMGLPVLDSTLAHKLARKAHVGLISVSFMSVFGCVNEMVADPTAELGADLKDQGAGGDQAVIVGSLNWQDVTTLPEGSAERANSLAVAYLDIPAAGSRCTGFLIAPNVVMTNQHCIPRAQAAQGVTATFRYESGVSPDAFQSSTFDCSTFLGNDATLDFALLQCAGSPGDTFGVVELEPVAMARNAGVYALHQNCDYYAEPSCAPTKKYSPGRVVSVATEITHDADTLGGSSGSPLFSRATHKVIGLHHVGMGNDGSGRGSANRAVPMTSIVPVLQQRYPGLALGGRAPVDGGGSPAPVQGDAADGYEPNDTLPGAVQVQLPFNSVDARIDPRTGGADVDHFTFVADGSTRTIRLTFQHARGDLDLYAYDAAGNELAKSVGTTDVEELTAAFPSGSVTVRIVGYRSALGSYALDVR